MGRRFLAYCGASRFRRFFCYYLIQKQLLFLSNLCLRCHYGFGIVEIFIVVRRRAKMAQSSKSPQEFIQDVFRPMVAVLCSPTVDYLVHKNNLNFVDLLQPFCGLNTEGQVRDPAGTQCIVRKWKLNICDVNSRPPQPTFARRMLNEAVGKSSCPNSSSIQLDKHKIEIPSSTPWFEEWRETFINVQYPSDHEFTKHFVACMIVATSSEPNASETFAHMVQQLALLQNVTPPKLPKWFNSNVLRSYVLLHDVQEGNRDKADRAFESLKQTYGAGNCFFLAINSRAASETSDTAVPDIWQQYLSKKMDGNETGSEKSSLPRTPVDARVVSNMPSVVDAALAEMQSETGEDPMAERGPEVSVHPLSPTEPADIAISFDSANSLQISEMQAADDSTYINSNVWVSESVIQTPTVNHGVSLTSTDLDNIKLFLVDFAFKALLPYFERQISQLHDAVANKKGVSRSLLSATKRWFGTNKPGINHGINSVIYAPECPELQLRRLGDLWFLLGQWNNAFQAYHTAKREFSADSAWLCYAGALEMAALSAFMASEASKKTYDYMEESISIYLNTCRMPQFAVRATLLSMQCLKAKGFYGEAALQLIRMSSEECDLRSAILLEQAALCFVAGPANRPFIRKYAFHMVLAGHRYSKAGQKKHALRCYNQAYQIYGDSGWRLAVDHVQFTSGRLAGQLGSLEEASFRLAAPLQPFSPQPPPQQASLLREYMLAHQQWAESNADKSLTIPNLPLPLLRDNDTKVLCGGFMPLSSPYRIAATGMTVHSEDYADDSLADAESIWVRLEKMLIHRARGSPPMIFKPSISLYANNTDNSAQPVSPRGEPIQVSLKLENPLQIPLNIMNIQLLWHYRRKYGPNGEEDELSNENHILSGQDISSDIIASTAVSQVVLQADEINDVLLNVTPAYPGELTITGVAFKLSNSIQTVTEKAQCIVILGKQHFKIRGPKLKITKESNGEQPYGIDKRLNISVAPSAPCLQVTFTVIDQDLVCGELQKINVEIRNVGSVGLKSLYLGVSHPQCISTVTEGDDPRPFSSLIDEKYTDYPPDLDERQMQMEREKRERKRHCIKILDVLGPGHSYTTDLWLQAPHVQGDHVLNALFYYENPELNGVPKHRLLRHTWMIHVQESVEVSAVPRRSIRLNPSTNSSEEILVIPVEIRNANRLHHSLHISAQVLEISLLSQNWLLKKLVPLKVSDKTLKPEETLLLVTQAERCNSEKLLSSFLSVDENSRTSIESTPYSKFVVDYETNVDILDNTLSKDRLLYPNISINSTLVVRWKAVVKNKNNEVREAIGQHRILLNVFNKRMSSPDKINNAKVPSAIPLKLFGSDATIKLLNSEEILYKSSENLATYRLQHANEIKHDFMKKKICMVPVRVHIVNCSKYSIKAMLDVLSSKSAVSSKIGWIGIVNGETGGIPVSINPHTSASINLIVTVSTPGRYLLGNTFKLYCKILNLPNFEKTILQACRTSSSLNIKSI